MVAETTYDPLAAFRDAISHVDLAVHDAMRQRDIQIRVYLPAATIAEPVVIFSPGMGGSRVGSSFLGKHWAKRGYVAVFLQHPGSDEVLWKKTHPKDRLRVMEEAASPQTLYDRIEDVRILLDTLEQWNSDKANVFAGRLDLSQIGMSGHSFGAVTTQAVSGETLPSTGENFTDARIKAAIAQSPNSPIFGGDAVTAFAPVRIPWMLMMGTKDIAPIGRVTMESRLGVYPALRGIPKYELILHEATHSVFIEHPLPGDRGPRNPNHHRVILALSTAFWDGYLRSNAQALEWLHGPAARSVMEPADQWQFEPH